MTLKIAIISMSKTKAGEQMEIFNKHVETVK